MRSLGAPGGNRTPDPQLRRLLLYPTELLARYDAKTSQDTDSNQSLIVRNVNVAQQTIVS